MLNADLLRLQQSVINKRGFARRRAEHTQDQRHGEQGFLLLGLIVAIFLILLVLGVAAPRVAHELRREREVETVHRGNQYVQAIRMYYKKMGHYPASIDQLEKSNNIRFLRQRYVDPMTGKADWRLIHVGEAKTTVKGFFGQPLAGIASSGLGSAAGMASPGGTGSAFGSSSSATGSSFGSSSNRPGSSFGSPSSSTGSAFGSSTSGTGLGSSSAAPGPGGAGSSSGGIGSQSATDLKGSEGPFVGVGLPKEGDSITVLNEQTTYSTWEFLYDPRIEQMKDKVSLFGGGMTSTNATGLGSASDMKSGFGSFGNSQGSSPGQSGTSPGGSGNGANPTPASPSPQP